jgi:hypothetical protein
MCARGYIGACIPVDLDTFAAADGGDFVSSVTKMCGMSKSSGAVTTGAGQRGIDLNQRFFAFPTVIDGLHRAD